MSTPSWSDWEDRLDQVLTTMREFSQGTDPQEMVSQYGERVRAMLGIDRMLSLTCRGLDGGQFRVARSTTWDEDVNPWEDGQRLPVMRGGFLGQLIGNPKPQIIDDLQVPPSDPAAAFCEGMGSLLSIPVFDGGEVLNTVVVMRQEKDSFIRERIPEMVWTTNLLGRATHNLALSAELQRANDAIDREMKSIAAIQKTLLPQTLPQVPGLELAAAYRTADRAGGDYYDVFELEEDRIGVLIADVAGHGTSAAVIMAITHSLAHSYAGPQGPPGDLLCHVNNQFEARYGSQGAFVTAFYAIFDPKDRSLTWASAGHNPPRLLRHNGSMESLISQGCPPLGVVPDQDYSHHALTLEAGDHLLLYTDGITEAREPSGRFLSLEGLDALLKEALSLPTAQATIDQILSKIDAWCGPGPRRDDQTIMLLRAV